MPVVGAPGHLSEHSLQGPPAPDCLRGSGVRLRCSTSTGTSKSPQAAVQHAPQLRHHCVHRSHRQTHQHARAREITASCSPISTFPRSSTSPSCTTTALPPAQQGLPSASAPSTRASRRLASALPMSPCRSPTGVACCASRCECVSGCGQVQAARQRFAHVAVQVADCARRMVCVLRVIRQVAAEGSAPPPLAGARGWQPGNSMLHATCKARARPGLVWGRRAAGVDRSAPPLRWLPPPNPRTAATHLRRRAPAPSRASAARAAAPRHRRRPARRGGPIPRDTPSHARRRGDAHALRRRACAARRAGPRGCPTQRRPTRGCCCWC